MFFLHAIKVRGKESLAIAHYVGQKRSAGVGHHYDELSGMVSSQLKLVI